MFFEADEGLGLSPTSRSCAVEDVTTFCPESYCEESNRTINSKRLPQSLDLKNVPYKKIFEKSLENTKLASARPVRRAKPSPIKASPEKQIQQKPRRDLTQELFESCIMENTRAPMKKFDSKEYKHNIDFYLSHINKMTKQRSHSSSTDSDVASSILSSKASTVSSSTQTTDKRSLYREIARSKGLVKEKKPDYASVNESNFDIKVLDLTKEDRETCRKEDRLASLLGQLSVLTGGRTEQVLQTALDSLKTSKSTNTSAVLSDTQLAKFNNKKTTFESGFEKARDASVTRQHIVPPIVNLELGLDAQRSEQYIPQELSEVLNGTKSTNDGTQETIHHSYSQHLLPIKKHIDFSRSNISLPNLRSYAAKERDIFDEIMDIDELRKKGVRKDPEREEEMFGGKQAAAIVHGEEAPTRRAQKQTIASEAKKRSASTRANDKPFVPPGPDGLTHSVAAISQNFLALLKTRYPEWLPLGHVLVNQPSEKDIAGTFCMELRRKARLSKEKYRLNKKMRCEDDVVETTTQLHKIERVLAKMEEMMGQGKLSRSQQLKCMLHAVSNS